MLCATCAHAGAWLQPEGKGLVIGQAAYYSTTKYFDAQGNTQPQPRFSKYEFQPYVEYGLLEKLTVGGSLYAQSVEQSGITNYGIADPELFLRAKLWRDDKQALSLQPLIKFPSQFASDLPPRGGSKSTDMELSLLYGRNLKLISDSDYLDTRIGYRGRDQGLSNQWRADAALGLSLTPHWQLIPAIRAVYTPGLQQAAAFSENGDLDGNVLKVELNGAYHIDEKRWVQLGLFKHIAGMQTGEGYGASISYAHRF